MDYLEICEWDRFQHYKKRNPPWVKLYSAVLDDDDFDAMPDASKLLFFCLLPFASRRNNKIKNDLSWLQKKLPISTKITKKTLQPLVDAGFINCYQDASKKIALNKQDATPETETETEQSKGEAEKSREETGEFPESLNVPIFLTAWEDWKKHRVEIRHKLTPTTISRQLKMLGKHPAAEAVAIIEASIQNGWQGLFPDRLKGASNGKQSGQHRRDFTDHSDFGTKIEV